MAGSRPGPLHTNQQPDHGRRWLLRQIYLARWGQLYCPVIAHRYRHSGADDYNYAQLPTATAYGAHADISLGAANTQLLKGCTF